MPYFDKEKVLGCYSTPQAGKGFGTAMKVKRKQ
jgi:hypothetical protein